MSKARKISVIDDDESVRQALKGLIRSLGYDAATFASAEEYLDSAHLLDTSCLITDIHMPGISGIELQEKLMNCGHRTKIIFITGFPEETLRKRALQAGAMGFLKKPFNDDCLVKCIDRALESAGDGTANRL
jgi:FixJ family two-component response regulator